MTKVKWKHLYHDAFEDPEDFYEDKEGEVVSFVSGFQYPSHQAVSALTCGFLPLLKVQI